MEFKYYIEKILLKCYSPYPYRPYNDKARAIFIHIPKTAGSSLLSAIGAPPIGRLHLDYSHYMCCDPVRFNNYFKFAIVRDPLDRAYSCYKYLISGGNQSSEDHGLRLMVEAKCRDFDGFVQDFMTPSILANWNMLRPQTSFVYSRTGTLMIDLVLKYESLDSDYQCLRKHLPLLASELPRINVGQRSLEIPASLASIEKLKEFYRLDFEAFYE